MKYSSNLETTFLEKRISNKILTYRLFKSNSELRGNYLLISIFDSGSIEDIFIPFVCEMTSDAEALTQFLFNNDVTPCTALEIIDEFIGCFSRN